MQVTTKQISSFFRNVLLILFYCSINMCFNLLLKCLCFIVPQGEKWFIRLACISWFVVIGVAIHRAKKLNRMYSQSVLEQLIEIYDTTHDELTRFSYIENRILREQKDKKEKSIRRREVKTAHMIKALVEKDLSMVQTISTLNIIFTLTLRLYKESGFEHIITMLFLILLMILSITLVNYMPKEKYILNICDKIIQESKVG